MMWKTHLAGALLLGLLLRSFFPSAESIVFYVVVISASFIPDIDHPSSWINNRLKVTKIISAFVKHRGIFHSGLFGVSLTVLTYLFISKTYAWPLLIGFFSHILLDGLTREGVNLLHPLGTLHMRGPIITNSLQETVTFGLILLGVAWQVLH